MLTFFAGCRGLSERGSLTRPLPGDFSGVLLIHTGAALHPTRSCAAPYLVGQSARAASNAACTLTFTCASPDTPAEPQSKHSCLRSSDQFFCGWFATLRRSYALSASLCDQPEVSTRAR